MAYEDLEIALFGSRKVELYEFITPPRSTDAAGTFRLTSSNVPIVYMGEEFEPAPGLSRTEPRSANDGTAGQMNITVPNELEVSDDNDILSLWHAGRPPLARIQLRVYVAHILQGIAAGTPAQPADDFTLAVEDDNVINPWRGYVSDAVFGPEGGELSCSSVLSELLKTGLRRTYQGTCNNVLYDEFCTVDPMDARFRFEGTLTRLDGATAIPAGDMETLANPILATVDGLNTDADGARPPQFFKAGHIVNTTRANEQLTISVNPTNAVITLQEMPDAWRTGDAVVVQAGCPHRYSFCEVTFDNGNNFGAYHLLPNTDPHIRVRSNPVAT